MTMRADQATYETFMNLLTPEDLVVANKLAVTIDNIMTVSALANVPQQETAKRLAVTILAAVRSTQSVKH